MNNVWHWLLKNLRKTDSNFTQKTNHFSKYLLGWSSIYIANLILNVRQVFEQGFWLLHYIHVEEQNSSLVQHQSIAAKDVAGGYLDKTLTLSDFLRKLYLVEFFSKCLFILDLHIPFRIFCRLLVHYPTIIF